MTGTLHKDQCTYWIPKATYTQIFVVLLFHYNASCTNAPRFYVYVHVHCLSSDNVILIYIQCIDIMCY
jgi:hypothetical protein